MGIAEDAEDARRECLMYLIASLSISCCNSFGIKSGGNTWSREGVGTLCPCFSVLYFLQEMGHFSWKIIDT